MIKKIYDIIGIGIGPFNLGLAALAEDITNLECIFFDQARKFDWHPGLLFETARLQVPFYADLVTLADPTSRFSYLNFLKEKQRMIRFGIHQHGFPSRIEYNLYCQWAAGEMSSLEFNSRCTGVLFNSLTGIYTVEINDLLSGEVSLYYAKHIVLGVGTVPHLPEAVKNIEHDHVFHASEYLSKKPVLKGKGHIAIIGAGQSAAEIFDDLLPCSAGFERLSWFTRSSFTPMDASAFALEMASPDYINYFYSLNDERKQNVLSGQDHLYKGVNCELLAGIYDKLYMQNIIGERDVAFLFPNAELANVLVRTDGSLRLDFMHTEMGVSFSHDADAVVLATGYKHVVPSFLAPLGDHLLFNLRGYYQVNKNYSTDVNGNSFFVQNADLYSHGFNSSDIGLGPYRNAIILNAILGYEHFKLETDITFQKF